MSRTFINNMTHFLNDKGNISERLPKRARALAERTGMIVSSVTHQPEKTSGTTIPCWNRINKKQCGGNIAAGIELESFNILWHCLRCGDNGSINHWQNTLWDHGFRG